ncbi:mono-functional DNA-alkylating methyl methanesulfonate N-term-domain-containing protein [Lasiosphaeris hirsuta]|uniref:Mono-functional DNA-alkylating methyl methanesulfonate N-term-domain-containing protein n=1 Tax=Lasiosphaeris hirsuta TaxID=260670 RepID=A0AA40DVE5_9PEZI|nr:mono-functional DNA-alkylating methyl methanesulfonate N-term-domain-containing protein [Lasiosphaeris hirsuta]
MAFQTNVLRGGEWVTETMTLQTVLKANNPGQKKQRLLKPPQCGLLTRTVVESHLVNSILPIRLRSPQRNDVAFVGDHEVRVCELRRDGQLKEIVRKSDFGSRIRNACVVGSFDIKDDDGDETSLPPSVKTEDNDSTSFQFSASNAAGNPPQLPPQMLLLVLECGDSVFLFVRPGSDGWPEFAMSRFVSPREQLVYPGFHLAIDPTSRYVALACAQEFFVVYELESLETLGQKYSRNEPLNPVKSFRPRSVQGVIHKVNFLYPRPGDDSHIILLLIVVRNGRSRMVTYEWRVGDDLKTVFAEEKHGHRMPVENQMPVLLIPLTVRSAFIAISPNQVAVCTEGLYGPPNFETIEMETPPATRNFHGRREPLWTAWARPFRLSPYFKTRDCIYLAREDGVVIFIEADRESALDRSTFMDTFDSNISTAFTCMFDQYTDVLILGSDSGPGAIWKVPARQPLELLGTLPNWSPSVDFITTDEFSTWNQEVGSNGNKMVPWQGGQLRQPDRVFATSGRGKKGSITEYRYGLRANIALDLEYGTEIKEAWLFPTSYSPASERFHMLLSMPGCSALLRISEDFSQAKEAPSDDENPYDLSSPTLAVVHSDHLVVQVTTAFVALVAGDKSFRFPISQILRCDSRVSVSDACILDDCIAISTHTNTQFEIHTIKIDTTQPTQPFLVYNQTIKVNGDITCLSLGANYTILAGLWHDGRALLAKALLQQTVDELETIDISQALTDKGHIVKGDGLPPVEAIASITSVWGSILVGTRSGEVIKMTGTTVEYEKFGTTTAKITRNQHGKAEPTVLVSCDKNLVLLRNQGLGSGLFDSSRSKDKLRIWPVEANNLVASAPPVDYGIAVDIHFSSYDTTLLMISGTKILLTEMNHEPGPVHRHLPVEGTPMKVIYSQSLQCLIAAVSRDDKPTLMFIDPDTGEDLGRPTEKKTNTPVDFISGLGRPGDRIFGLAEWEFKKDGNVWRYILVSTRDGRLIVISAERGEAREEGPPPIRYWMRFQKKGFDRPVYSVVGYDEGLIYCVGQTIHWDVLDTTEKKLKPIKSFELASPATSLRIVNGKLMALTSRDSLEIIDHSSGDSETMGQSHVDPKTRNAIHMMEVAGTSPDEPLGSIVLLADRDCGIAGLWVPWQSPGRDCEVVLEAELPTSIRRFRRGRTRPIWEQGQHTPKYGRLASTVDDAEILGISLDGSMQHFTLLSIEIWRFLRFIQNIALTNEELYPFTHERDVDYGEFDPEPRLDRGLEMHVDGDMLRRCLEKRALERLVSWPSHESRFAELLDELDDGRYTAGLTADGGREQYFKLAYDILDYFLRPAL